MSQRRLPADRRNQSDRRDQPRMTLAAELRFLRSGPAAHEVLEAELCDVSATGVRLTLDADLNPGDTVLMELRGEQERCLNLAAQVVWIEPGIERRHQVGCELRLELTRGQQSFLREFIVPRA